MRELAKELYQMDYKGITIFLVPLNTSGSMLRILFTRSARGRNKTNLPME